jgi:hypothetical protein
MAAPTAVSGETTGGMCSTVTYRCDLLVCVQDVRHIVQPRYNYCTPILRACQLFLGYTFDIVLQKLFIVAVFLNLLAYHYDDQRRQATSAAKGQQPAAYAPSALVEQTDGPALQKRDPSQKAEHDQSIRVVSLPAKDKYDYISLGATILLTLVGIVGVGAGVCTLRTIQDQTNELIAQNRTMVAKERARLDLKAVSFAIDNPVDRWSFEASIDLRNIGASNAYLGKNAGAMYVTRSSEDPSAALEDSVLILSLPDKLLAPSISPFSVPFWFWSSLPDDEQNPLPVGLPAFTAEVFAGTLFIHLCGFVEYETLGTYWRREFWYVREEGFGMPRPYPNSPQTAQDKLLSRYWRERKTAEYEIKQKPN